MNLSKLLMTFPIGARIHVLMKSGSIVSGKHTGYGDAMLSFERAMVNAQSENHHAGALSLSEDAVEAVWLDREE